MKRAPVKFYFESIPGSSDCFFFLKSEQARRPEVQGVNKVRKICFSEQIRRENKKEWFFRSNCFLVFEISHV